MLLSLLIKVRSDGEAAIARIRQSLRQTSEMLPIARQAGQALAIGLAVGTVEAVRFGSAIGKATQEGKALLGTLLHGTLGLGAAAYGFKKGFLDIAESSEQMRAKLKAIEGTDGRAEAVMSWTKAFRKETATTVADVREAWMELRNNAIRPTEFTLKAIADAAAASGKTMAETAKLFADVVEGKRLSKLDDFGIEADKVGQQLVFTYRHLGKVMKEAVPKDNKILVGNKLAEIITKLRGGAAADAAKGWRGLMLDMSESWQDFALEVMDKGGVFATLKSQLANFATGGRNLDGMSENAHSLATALKEAIIMAFEFATFLRDNLPTAIRYAKEFTTAVGGWKVVLGIVVGILALPFLASLLSAAGALITLGSTIFTIIVPALVAIVTVITGSVIPVVYSLGAALLTTPIGWIIMGIVAVIAAAWLLYENWDAVVAALGQVWDVIKAAASAFWEALKGDVGVVANAFVSSWQSVKAFFDELWAAIKRGYDATFGAIVQGLTSLKSVLPSFGDVKLPSLSSLTGSVANFAKTQIDGVLKVAVEVTGPGQATVTEQRMRGPLDLDTSLGHTMVSP